MSTTTLAPTPVIEALMAAISRLTREERETLIVRVQSQLDHEGDDAPQWHLDILEEREERLRLGVEKPVPFEQGMSLLREKLRVKAAKAG